MGSMTRTKTSDQKYCFPVPLYRPYWLFVPVSLVVCTRETAPCPIYSKP